MLVVDFDATAGEVDDCGLELEVSVTGWTAPQAAAVSSMGIRRRFFMKHTSSQRWVMSPATGKKLIFGGGSSKLPGRDGISTISTLSLSKTSKVGSISTLQVTGGSVKEPTTWIT